MTHGFWSKADLVYFPSTIASMVKTTQSIILKPSDNDVAVVSKDEMMSKANEALKKLTLEMPEDKQSSVNCRSVFWKW